MEGVVNKSDLQKAEEALAAANAAYNDFEEHGESLEWNIRKSALEDSVAAKKNEIENLGMKLELMEQSLWRDVQKAKEGVQRLTVQEPIKKCEHCGQVVK